MRSVRMYATPSATEPSPNCISASLPTPAGQNTMLGANIMRMKNSRRSRNGIAIDRGAVPEVRADERDQAEHEEAGDQVAAEEVVDDAR